MPDADGLRQRAERWLVQHEQYYRTPGWVIPPSEDEAVALIRDLLVAVGDQEVSDLRQRVGRQAVTIHEKREAWAAEHRQRQALQARIAALEQEIRAEADECYAASIVPCQADYKWHADTYYKWADILATLIQPGAASPKEEQ